MNAPRVPRWILWALVLGALSPALAQRMYDSSGRSTGRMEGERIYDGSGRMLGRIEGERVYDASGRQIARTDGMRRMQIIVYFFFFM